MSKFEFEFDLLTHYPRAYENHSNLTKISEIYPDEKVVVVFLSGGEI